MVRIGKNHLRTRILELAGRDTLDRCERTHRHKARCFYNSMGRRKETRTSMGVAATRLTIKGETQGQKENSGGLVTIADGQTIGQATDNT